MNLLAKGNDPRTVTILYMIDNTRIEKAILDLGASINVLPYSIYTSLILGHSNETKCCDLVS